MLKYIILFFLMLFFLFSCTDDRKKTIRIINHNGMVKVLTAVHLVDGRLYSVAQVPDSLYKYGSKNYRSVFKKYHTDSAQFKRSLQYFTTQPVELLAIYDQVIVNLKKKTDSLTKSQRKQNALSR